MAFDVSSNEMPADWVEVEIVDVGFGGDGVGRLENGIAVFIPYVLPGETVRAKVFDKKKRFWKAWPKEIVAPSADRIQSQCPHYMLCAGCVYQHVPYVRERAIKENQVQQLLKRIGSLDAVPVSYVPLPASIDAEDGFHYRNRATVHRAKRQCGFFKHDNHQVLTIKQCPISLPALGEMIYDEAKHVEGLPRVDLRVDTDGKPVSQAQAWFMVEILGRPYKVPLESFFQTNFEGAAQLITAIGARLEQASNRRLLIDGYGGVGLFSAAFAGLFKKTVLVELDRKAVEAARENLAKNQPDATFDAHAAPLETTLSSVLRKHDPRETHVILDPPRIGLQPQIIDILLARTPHNIFYISCDPAKMARDLSRLSQKYKVHSINLVDMFPRTAHIESIAFLEHLG